MTDSIRQKIISAIDTRLKSILIAGGYETDIGQNVWDWRAESLEEDNLPALIYRDTGTETEFGTFTTFTHKMTVNIMVAVSSTTPMTTIRKIIADIDRAIGMDDTWGGLALMTIKISDESQVEIDEVKFAGCQVVIEITFRTTAWNDYTQI